MTTTAISADSRTVTLRDGRTLSYAEYGILSGTPVIGFHGMPGSRLMMKALEPAVRTAGARLIAPERPGYGLSDPHRRGTLLTYPQDIVELADALGLERFAALGVSGGALMRWPARTRCRSAWRSQP